MERREFLYAAAAGLAGTGLFRVRPAPRVGPTLVSGPIDAAAFHAMRKFAPTRFGRIAYVERGLGEAALFLHGDPLNGFQWRGALERLSSERRCIAPDLMGLGYGEIPAGQSLAPEAQADMCAALLDVLAIRSVDLVGSDSGGAVAQLLVARHPERVRTLLLTNCDSYENSPPEALAPVIAGARRGTLVKDTNVRWLADTNQARAALGTAYTDPAHLTDEAIEVYLRPSTTSPLRTAQFHEYQIALDRNALLPVVPQLRQNQIPVQLIWGIADSIFTPGNADALARLFPRCRGVRKLEGAKLFFPEEFPDIVAQEARRLWGRSEDGREVRG